MVIWGKVTVGPRQSLYSPLCCIPHDVADCVNRWLGDEADGTAVKSLLKTPNSRASAALMGTCSGENILTAVAPVALAPCAAEYLSDCSEYGNTCGLPPGANLPAKVS